MAKLHTQYVCQECGRTSVRLLGRCPSCGEWDSMVEEVIENHKEKQTNRLFLTSNSKPIKINEILKIYTNEYIRLYILFVKLLDAEGDTLPEF